MRKSVKDLSLRGCAKESVGEQGGCVWSSALLRDLGPVSRFLFGRVLQRQQVGLLLLQALMEPLGLALLFQLPPLELLSQRSGSGRDDEKGFGLTNVAATLKSFPCNTSKRRAFVIPFVLLYSSHVE